MKLRYLNLLISTIIATGAVHAAEIYNKDGNLLDFFGTISNGYYFSSNNDFKGGDHSFIRYGLACKTQDITQFVGFGLFEYEAKLKYIEQNSKSGNLRLGYVGLEFGDFGRIDYGRNYGLLYDVSSWTNVMPEFSGDNYLADNFLSNRASNVITYRNKDFFGFLVGLDFAVQYQGKNDVNKDQGRSLKESNGEGYAVSLLYNLDHGVSAAAAYSNSKRTLDQISLNGGSRGSNGSDDGNGSSYNNNAIAYSFGLKYNENNFYLAAMYGETRNMTPFGNFSTSDNVVASSGSDSVLPLVSVPSSSTAVMPSVSVDSNNVVSSDGGNISNSNNNKQHCRSVPLLGGDTEQFVYGFFDKARNIEFVAQYQFDFGLRPSLGYLHSKVSNMFRDYGNYLKRYIEVGTSYNFNKNLLAKVDYKINLLRKDKDKNNFVQVMKLSTDNVFALGISYIF